MENNKNDKKDKDKVKGKPYPDESSMRGEIVRVGKLMYDKELVVSIDGNISARIGPEAVLVTPSGLCKGMLHPGELLVVNLEGERIDTPTEANAHLVPTSETFMHLEAYRRRPDIGAVVHAHPRTAIALSIAGVSLEACMLPEVIVQLGLIVTAPYSTPASKENVEAIREKVVGHDAIILQRHGVLTVGKSPLDAFFKLEVVEHIAKVTLTLEQLEARDKELPPHQVRKLLDQREKMGLMRPGEREKFGRVCGEDV